jgi:hypothetical protein
MVFLGGEETHQQNNSDWIYRINKKKAVTADGTGHRLVSRLTRLLDVLYFLATFFAAGFLPLFAFVAAADAFTPFLAFARRVIFA